MKHFTTTLAAVAVTSAFGVSAFAASPDVYVVNFRDDKSAESLQLDRALNNALMMVNHNIEEVIIDTSNAAKWEKSAHEAFDRNIVPVFNKWVGLPGFAAVIDADTKRVMGCINSQFSASEIAQELSRMSAQAQGSGYMSRASTFTKSTHCPAAYNQDPGQ